MTTKEITIIETGSASDFLRLAVHVQGKLNRDRIIMNNETWQGYIIKVDLDNGLTMYCWNCRLSQPITLYHTLIPGNHISCSLAYNLNPGSVICRGPLLLHPWTNIFFSNNSSSTAFDLVPRKKIQFIYFSITKDWLVRQFRNNESLNKLLKNYISKGSDAYFSTSSSQEYDAASEIFEKIQSAANSSLSIQSKAFLLLSSFLEKLLITKTIIPEQVAYFQKIRQAKIILNTHLTTALPSLRSIAKETGLSEAGLKRYFKTIYGSNIYKYYLQQKMELAKRMLIERNMNVNEVAAHLGYANVSSFIEVFKKHFGYQPGLVRKS